MKNSRNYAKICAAIVAVMAAITLSGSNRQVIDTTYTYRYAILEMPDGTVVEGPVDSWRDYEGEQLQVSINGTTYLTSTFSCTLMTQVPEGR